MDCPQSSTLRDCGTETMADPPKKVYWDSCAWIGFINEEPDKITPLRAIWDEASRGQIVIWTSTYSYLEVMRSPPKFGEAYPPEEEDGRVFSMFEQSHVNRAAVDVEIAKLARRLKREHHPTLSKRPDAIHLATAVFHNVDELHTWDSSDLLPFNGKILRRDGVPLIICIPSAHPAGPLFGNMEESGRDGDE